MEAGRSIGSILCTVDTVYSSASILSSRPARKLHRISTSFVIDIDLCMSRGTIGPPIGVSIQVDDNTKQQPTTKFGILPEEDVLSLYRSILSLMELSPSSTMNLSTTAGTSTAQETIPNGSFWNPIALNYNHTPSYTALRVVTDSEVNRQNNEAA